MSDNWNPNVYSTNASFVYSEDFTSPVLKLLAPQKGEVILDLGSGSGELSLRISELLGNKGTLILVDSSPSLMEKAEFILRGKKGISFILEDGHNLINLDIRPVDAVFSNAALHWMKKDPGLVVEGVFKNLKKGGRFCGEFGGFLNMVGVRSSLHTALKSRGIDPIKRDPFYFPTVSQYSKLLESNGFKVEVAELIPRPTLLPFSGLRGWLATFAFSFFEGLEDEVRWSIIEEVCQVNEVDMKDENDDWTVMYVRLRFRAIKML